MIGSIRGKLAAHETERLLLEVAGVGYWVHVTTRDLGTALSAHNAAGNPADDPANQQTELFFWTQQIVREDAILLYGFTSRTELDSFNILIGIPRIGPQMAMSVLGTFATDQLHSILVNEDIDSLCQVPGIGPKRARQFLVQLKDSFAGVEADTTAGAQPSTASAEARVALLELGYSPEEISQALSKATEQVASDADTETILKAALQLLAK